MHETIKRNPENDYFNMKKAMQRITASILVLALLPSCHTTLSEFAQYMPHDLPIPIPGNSGPFPRKLDKWGAAVTFAIIAIKVIDNYQATERQRQLAVSRARYRLKDQRVNQGMQRKKMNKVAVVVPASEGKKKGVMLMDSNGKPTDGKVYVPENSSDLKQGEVISLGRTKAYLADSWHSV